MKICIVSFGISHVIIAISCVLTYNIVFQMAIKNWTDEKKQIKGPGALQGRHPT